MSTIPLILIEGATAMPRLRPLHHVPTSFGGDWTLLPPARNWRAELHALYAAVLHTFCLSDRAILSLCKWVPLDRRRVAANLDTMSGHAAAHAASRVDTRVDTRVVAEGVVRSTTIESPVPTASGTGAIRRGAWAGGACVVGGVAVLGWLAFSHLERHPAGNPKPEDGAVVSKRAEPAKPPMVETAVETVAGARTDNADNAGTGVRRGVKPVVVPASAPVAIKAPVPQHVAVDTPVARSEKPAKERAATIHHPARNVIRHPAPRVATKSHKKPRAAAPVSIRNQSPAPSSAGDYSPFAPTRLGVDEYASVTLSASTHLRDNVTGSRGPSLEPAETEWMARRSQRRITETPEQFSN